MPLLARTVNAPLFVEVRPGAIAELGKILSDRRISAGGRVAAVVGDGQGDLLSARLADSLAGAPVFPAQRGSVDEAAKIVDAIGSSMYDAIVGIGGGRTLDVTKWVATRLGLPMIAVATNLAHDGIASPVSSLTHDGGKGSYGVAPPVAVIVDLDYVRTSPPAMLRAGIGDVVSNISAIEDWELAHRMTAEPIDGFAVSLARAAAVSILYRQDGVDSDAFLTVLAEALVLSGMAMVAAGSSRPCSGADHEILHAIEQLYPGKSSHGELAGVGALFASYLRDDHDNFKLINECLFRHGLPRLPGDLGLSEDQFLEAVTYAPHTRPARYTILEHLGLAKSALRSLVRDFSQDVRSGTAAEPSPSPITVTSEPGARFPTLE